MDQNFFNKFSYIQNRSQICLYQKSKNKKSISNITWQDVSRIIYFYDDTPLCAICLNEPFLPRMDRCGHIFCFSCIITLVNFANSKFAPCPMCKDVIINLNSIKRVEFMKNKSPINGKSIKFNLLVKISNEFSPRNADDVYKVQKGNIPIFGSEMSNYLNISLDYNQETYDIIRKDFKEIQSRIFKNSRIIKENDISQIESLLSIELNAIECEMEMNCGFIDAEEIIQFERFNLLEFEKNNSKYVIFYQSSDYRFVYLDKDLEASIINDALKSGKLPPISITGKIISQNIQTVNEKFLSGSRLNHLSVGLNINFVKINLKSALFTEISDKKLNNLKVHQEVLIKERKLISNMFDEIVSRANERKNLPRQPRKLSNKEHDSSYFKNIKKERVEDIVSGFNFCTIGLSCIDPDDDYPHEESCCYFKPLSRSSLMLKKEEHKEKFFGLQRLKMNVYHPKQSLKMFEKVNRPEQSLVTCTINYPPEYIEDLPISMTYDNNKLNPYIVEKKQCSQRQQKLLRKLKVKA